MFRRVVGALVGVVVALALAYVFAMLAGSSGPWFVLVPIGLIVGTLAGGAWGTVKRCPVCGEQVRVSAQVCSHCGHTFAGAAGRA